MIRFPDHTTSGPEDTVWSQATRLTGRWKWIGVQVWDTMMDDTKDMQRDIDDNQSNSPSTPVVLDLCDALASSDKS